MTSIAGAPFLARRQTRAVMDMLESEAPGGSRFVGGCVRNALMGRAVDDIDIATQLLPPAVIAAATRAGFAAVPTGLEHGTVTVVAEHVPFEITTLRRDVTTDGRRATVAFTTDWTEDAGRRDFRMNALYADAEGRVFDPTGGGVADAAAGRVIFIGDADTRILEDHLRILRFFRFNAWYGAAPFDGGGLAACARHVGALAALSAERVWKELKKTLAAPDPRAAVTGLAEIGGLGIIAPEATQLQRLSRMVAIDVDFGLPGDSIRRLAAAVEAPDRAAALARRLKLSNDERDRLLAALGDQPRIVSYLSLRELRRALYRLGARTFEDRARIAWAKEENPKTHVQWRALLALASGWTPPKLPLTGEEVIAAGVSPGPAVGNVMREVEAWWVDADFPDDKLALAERLKAVALALG